MITEDTMLQLKVEWKNPYNSYKKGDSATASYWAKKVGVPIDEFIKDFNVGYLYYWYQIQEQPEEQND